MASGLPADALKQEDGRLRVALAGLAEMMEPTDPPAAVATVPPTKPSGPAGTSSRSRPAAAGEKVATLRGVDGFFAERDFDFG
jgi:hypothetical protein